MFTHSEFQSGFFPLRRGYIGLLTKESQVTERKENPKNAHFVQLPHNFLNTEQFKSLSTSAPAKATIPTKLAQKIVPTLRQKLAPLLRK